jgi:hypothetical protein
MKHFTMTPALIAILVGGLVACGGPEFEDGGETDAVENQEETRRRPDDDTSGIEGQGPDDIDPEMEEQADLQEQEQEQDQEQEGEQDPVDPEIIEDDRNDDDVVDLSAFIAPLDGDSLQAPAVSEFLRITGTRELVYFDQVSAQQGDADDWVEFELPNNSNRNQRITAELQCEFSGIEPGNAQVRVTVFEDGVENLSLLVFCNDGPTNLTVDNTKVQTARVHFSIQPVDGQVLVDYQLRIVGFR